jgi:hypothetical protein
MTHQRPALRTDIHSWVVLPNDHVTKGLFSCFVSDVTTLVILLGDAGHPDLTLDWRLVEP